MIINYVKKTISLTDYDLRQLSEAWVIALTPAQKDELLVCALCELRKSLDRHKQTPNHSSKPPSSRAQWDSTCGDDTAAGQAEPKPIPAPAPALTDDDAHHPELYAGCGKGLSRDAALAYTVWDKIDIAEKIAAQVGLCLKVIRHTLFACPYACGHVTRASHHVAPDDPLWDKVALGQWRLIGHRLAGAIVFLARTLCERHRDGSNDKLRVLAREFLLDWNVILRQVAEPNLPLTNNVVEQSLRRWVIARRINMGTRSEAGSRAFALLASVIETGRKRSASSWIFVATLIAAARKSLVLPPLPNIAVGV